jgi:hypothetical protein
LLTRFIDMDGWVHYLSFKGKITKYNTVLLVAKYKFNKFTFLDFKPYGITHLRFRKIVSIMVQNGLLETSNTKPKIYTVIDPDSIERLWTEVEEKIAFLIIEDTLIDSKTNIYHERSIDSLIDDIKRDYVNDKEKSKIQN